MPWIYSITSGIFERPCPLPNGKSSRFQGYSGKKGKWKNELDHEGTKDLGPIPRGDYRIGPPYDHPKLGSLTMNLTPISHNALGRTDFRIHGDNKSNDASTGCIILDLEFREPVAEAVRRGDTLLTVVE